MRKVIFISLALLSSFAMAWENGKEEFTSDLTYENGVPSNWELVGDNSDIKLLSTQPNQKENEVGLGIDLQSVSDTTKTKTFRTTSHFISNNILCDNVCARVRVYMEKNDDTEKINSFQIVISTNGWQELQPITIGDPIKVFAKENENEWKTIDRVQKISGLKNSAINGISVGILVKAGYLTYKVAYLQSIEIGFVASATPTDVQFEVDNNDGDSTNDKRDFLTPGEENARVVATVEPTPTEIENGTEDENKGAVTVKKVYCVLDRNGIITTNDMSLAESSSTKWRTNPIQPAIDAGEELKATVFTEYQTKQTDFPKLGEEIRDEESSETYALEHSEVVPIFSTKKGSIWINEFLMDKVELCGTTNRVMLSGWKFELTNNETNYFAKFDGKFDFTANMLDVGVELHSGVGFETRELKWKTTESDDGFITPVNGNYTLRLLNSRGIVEHEVEVKLPLPSAAYGMTGSAPYNGEGYDWSGTVSSNWFEWVSLSESSFGKVNNFDKQGFKFPVSDAISDATLTVITGTGDNPAENRISYVTVNASMNGFNNDSSTNAIPLNPVQSEKDEDGNEGVAIFNFNELNAYSASPTNFSVDVSATAFGWVGDSTNVFVRNGEGETTLKLTPTVAFDDFNDTKLKDYWKADNTSKRKWNVSSNKLKVDAFSSDNDDNKSILKCANFFNSNGRKYVSISFDLTNHKLNSEAYDYFEVELSTDSGFQENVIKTLRVSDNRSDLDSGSYTYRTVIELPPEFLEPSTKIWLRLVNTVKNYTWNQLTVDNLKIAFQDVATGVGLTEYANNWENDEDKKAIAPPASGSSTDFTLDVVGQATGEVANVSADLHLVVNDEPYVVPFAFADGDYTNDVAAAAGSVPMTATAAAVKAALGRPFMKGDKVNYWAEIKFDPQNGKDAEEVRYYPDNHKDETSADGTEYWIVEGKESVVGSGDYYKAEPLEFEVTGGDLVTYIGNTNLTTTSFSFPFEVYADGLKSIDIVVTDKDGKTIDSTNLVATAANRVKGEFSTLTNGKEFSVSTEYTVTITCKDASGGTLRTETHTIATLAEQPTAVIRAIGTDTYELSIDEGKDKATSYTVSVSGSGTGSWEPQAEKWKFRKSGYSPNTKQYSEGAGEMVTICAKNSQGYPSEPLELPLNVYTWAAAATKAPVIVKGQTSVVVSAPEGYTAEGVDGNPEEDTKYAVRVTTSEDDPGKIVTTNGVDGAVEVWQTLEAWRENPVTVGSETLDLSATNTFSFLTRNSDEPPHVTTNVVDATTATNCTFDMTATIKSAKQTTVPFGNNDDIGKVDIVLEFFDPAQNDEDVALEYKAEVQYKIEGINDNWVTIGEQTVSFTGEGEDKLKTSMTMAWDAGAKVGENPDSYKYALRVQIRARKDGSSDWSRLSEWVEKVDLELDFEQPTVTLASDPRDPFNTPLAVTVTFSEPVYGFSSESVDVQNGTVTVEPKSASEYVITVQPEADGTVTVQIPAGAVTDEKGNKNVASDVLTRRYDSTAPTGLSLSGTPEAGADGKLIVTNDPAFTFTASASDSSGPLTYHWSTNGVAVTEVTESKFAGTMGEGTNTVAVYAKDAAGNRCGSIERTWVVDTIAPAVPTIDGTPANGATTKEAAVSLTATSSDATAMVYHWTFNGVESEGAALTGASREGANTAEVYATDEAGNVSATSRWSWTLDTTKPTNLVIDGSPAAGAVTSGEDFRFTATAEDATALTYHWTLNGAAIADASPELADKALEGTNTVTVYAKDAVGNECAPVSRTWVVDTTKPTNLGVAGYPTDGETTNGTAVYLTATAEDATRLTFRWILDGGEAQSTAAGEAFESRVEADGMHEIKYFATDEADNASATNTLTWTVDRVAPTVVELASSTPDPFGKGTGQLVAKVRFSEPVVGMTENAVAAHNGTVMSVVADDAEGSVYTVTVTPTADGEVRVSIAENAVKDVAGNWYVASASDVLTRRYDTVAPANLRLSGTPEAGADGKPVVTSVAEFEFTAAATDDTAITYHWSTNGVAVTEVTASEFAGTMGEGTNTVAVYAKDTLGNASRPVERTWVVDTIAPAVPAIDGTPTNGATTKEAAVSLTATSSDATAMVYHWTFNGVESEGAALTGVSQEGANTAEVYATDEAGNKSETVSWSWTLDTTKPTNLVIGGSPAAGAVTSGEDFRFTATAEDATALTYHWTLNGDAIAEASPELADKALEGTNTVSVYAKDAVGNECAPVSRTWVVDTTKPTNLGVAGYPTNGATTNGTEVCLTATAEDATRLTFHWILNDGEELSTAAGEAFESRVEADGVHEIKYFATDEADNASATNTLTWTVDRVAPTVVELASSTPDPFGKGTGQLVAKVRFSEPVVGMTENAVVAHNGTVMSVVADDAEGRAYTVTVTPMADGEVMVSIAENAVKDVAGNWYVASASDVLTRRYDTVAPANLRLSGTPEAGADGKPVVTSVAAFEFTAAATDDTAITYHWSTNGVTVTEVTESKFAGMMGEGTNTVAVYAEDAAGNRCGSVERTWVVDTIAPAVPAIDGTPANGATTKEAAVSLTVTSSDATAIVYHWTFNGVESDGAALTGASQEGANTAEVYATDEAGNKSETVSWSWTLDTTKPTNLVIDGSPAAGAVTSGEDFRFTATAEDATALTYHWTLNGAAIADASPELAGKALEGTNTVTVYAKDAVGNECGPVSRTWVVDTTKPTVPVISGVPEATTKATTVSLTATAEDATRLTFHWVLDGGEEQLTAAGEAFESAVANGTHQIACFATDEAGNVSATSTLTWTVDTEPPTNLRLSGTPGEGPDGTLIVTNDMEFAFTARATDDTQLTYRWTLNGVTVANGTSPNFAGTAREGTNTVSVWVSDVLGNECGPVSRTWVVDTTKPAELALTGLPIADDPAKISVTNGFDFALTAAAKDATALTYHWTTNGVEVTDCILSNFVGTVSEGTNTVTVYAKDAAENVCDAIERTWVVDTIKPTQPEITGLPDQLTNETALRLTATAEDATRLTFHWILDGNEVRMTAIAEAFERNSLGDGEHTIACYATDEAGNVSATNNWSWTVDTTSPTVELTGDNLSDAFDTIILLGQSQLLTMTLKFSEPVTDFTGEFISVSEGMTVILDTFEKKSETVYTVQINIPNKAGKYYVQVAGGVVKDFAGNGNRASARTFTHTGMVGGKIPEKPTVNGTPTINTTVRASSCGYDLSVSAADQSLTYYWKLSFNGDHGHPIRTGSGTTFKGEVDASGEYMVEVYAKNASGKESNSTFWSWTYEKIEVPSVDFGDEVTIAVDSQTGATNSVSFTEINFNPGAESTFTLTGFEASKAEITSLTMYFKVCDSLDGTPWYEPVKAAASYNSETKELTVTLPKDALQNEGDAYKSFFILGVSPSDPTATTDKPAEGAQ